MSGVLVPTASVSSGAVAVVVADGLGLGPGGTGPDAVVFVASVVLCFSLVRLVALRKPRRVVSTASARTAVSVAESSVADDSSDRRPVVVRGRRPAAVLEWRPAVDRRSA